MTVSTSRNQRGISFLAHLHSLTPSGQNSYKNHRGRRTTLFGLANLSLSRVTVPSFKSFVFILLRTLLRNGKTVSHADSTTSTLFSSSRSVWGLTCCAREARAGQVR